MWTGSLNQASRFRARASALSSVTRPTPAVAVELLIGRLWKHQPHWTEVPAFQVFRTGERCREQSTSAGQTNRVHTVPITFATFFLLFLWTRVANRVKTSQRQRFVLNDAILCFHWPNNFITNGENVTDMRVWLETKSVNANFSVSITVTLLCSIYIQLGRSVWFVKPTLQSIEWKSAHFAYLTGCTVYIRVDCPTNFFFYLMKTLRPETRSAAEYKWKWFWIDAYHRSHPFCECVGTEPVLHPIKCTKPTLKRWSAWMNDIGRLMTIHRCDWLSGTTTW